MDTRTVKPLRVSSTKSYERIYNTTSNINQIIRMKRNKNIYYAKRTDHIYRINLLTYFINCNCD